jgi:hypothetical protein
VDEIYLPGAPWKVGIWALDDVDGTNAKALLDRGPTTYAAGIAAETGNLWVGYILDNNRSIPTAEDTFDVIVFECEPWNTTYSIHVDYTNNSQRTTITKQEHLNWLNASKYDDIGGRYDSAKFREMVSLYHALVDLIKGTLGGGPLAMLTVNTTLSI